jgi:CRP/FNR family transcriptional regulator, cyclic AMP receptor protein
LRRGEDLRVIRNVRRRACLRTFRGGYFARAKVVRLPAGRVLFWEGDPGDGCYRVEDGLFKLTMVSKFGAERILAFHGPGDIVGELAIIDGLPLAMSAVAVRDAVLNFLSRTEFEAFAEKRPDC